MARNTNSDLAAMTVGKCLLFLCTLCLTGSLVSAQGGLDGFWKIKVRKNQINTSQQTPLTYPQIVTALNAKLPPGLTKAKLIANLIAEIGKRKTDKPLTADLEDILRQAGATDKLIEAIRENSPQSSTVNAVSKSEDPAADLARWRETVRRGNGASLIPELTAALDKPGNNPAYVLWLRGIAYDQTRQYQKMQHDLSTVWKLLGSPKSADDWVALCGASAVVAENNERSDEPCIKAIEFDPRSAEAHFGLGLNYSLKDFQDENERAIKEFNLAIEIDPQYVDAYLGRGRVYEGRKQYDLAISDYSKAIELNPNIGCLICRGYLYQERHQYDLAIADYSKEIEIDPTAGVAFLRRGQSYIAIKKYDLGIADYSKAIQIEPKFAAALESRGDAYAETKQYQLAINDYTKVIEIDPTAKDTYFARGLATYNLALADFAKTEGQDLKARTDALAREIDPAIADLTKAIELGPNDPTSYLTRAALYEAVGKRQLAEADEQKAKQFEKKPE